MNITKKHFPKIIQDNDELFISYLIGVIESVDELCSLEITKYNNSYRFRIAPSIPRYTNMLIEEIIKFYNMFNIRIELSKSIKTTAVISFIVEI